MEGEPRFVGIDVSKAQVDVAVRPTGQRWVVSYDETGIKELVSQMVDLCPAMVLLEATGGLELPLVAALAAAALAGGGGGRGPLQPGQRHLARQTRRLGRTLPGSGCSLHGDADRDPFQSRHQRLLPEAAGGRQGEESSLGRLHA